ncbi:MULTISPECIES: CoA transferase [Pseudonocardia]|uniref:E-cinnamoyl-CoA:R-phenyllactate CoA transferase n=2 Tax=Pseudonocardia TaxID=1847 RepID=A0A1Y2N780_PSEAH|nr:MULTISPECIES: CoA transferase [Pseudonocardia]OSY43325.1 E-cinnamoyl-CoA:R-phenyllactate CoA transferase [Pseudonocardia autotrophica]TDN71813.1 2-methylfumaryl-CoA isomerase [Pseudonocardia autotrophica]BBG02500.1 dehydratase [Pseudonocardia autotrophica]GEC26919.1 dehydratase [Pseudonocardia saturnea]
MTTTRPTSPESTRPLSGLHVVECASFVAGPTGGMTLAQLGASVIRIDPLGGGPDHGRWPAAGHGTGDSYYWASLNKGKRSIALDLRSEEGRELVVALATGPGDDRGVLVDNVVGRRWMANDVLTARRPDLIHVRVQGYPDGRPAVDYTVNAEVGIPQITGSEEGAAPVNHVLPAWDLVTGLTVSTTVLAALHQRSRTGRGVYSEIALSDVALAGVANLGWLSEAAETGHERPRHGNHVYGSFGIDVACSDGHRVMVVALTPGQWSALITVTGTDAVFAALETALDADLTDETERYRLRETIAAVLRPWFGARDSATVEAELNRARVLWGRYQGMTHVVDEHRAGAHPLLTDIVMPGGTAAITARSPIRWDGAHGAAGDAPRLGRETDEILAGELGLSAAEIGALHDRGVIG